MEVDGVILAAGLSSRAGANKLLMDLEGKSILERCLDSMSGVCSRIIVVGGHRFYDLELLLKSYRRLPPLEVIYNEAYKEGMFSSIIKGICQVRQARFFLCPGDYPLIRKQTYRDLLCHKSDIIVPTYRERRGHPVLIASHLIPSVVDGSNTTLRDFINANHPDYIEVSDPGILMDVDTMEDFHEISSYLCKHREVVLSR